MIMDPVIVTEVRQILKAHAILSSELTLSAGFANLVVLTPSHVVRLNEGRFAQAFAYEARVLAQLPQYIPHPVAIASGHRETGGEYLILERLPGANLEMVWPTLAPAEQRHVISELASIVHQLHTLPLADWMTNPWVEDTVANRRWRDAYHAPPAMSAHLVESAIAARPDLHRVLTDIACFIEERIAACVDEPQCFVHTDLHFRNVIVADGQVTGLIDFEGSRLGSPDVELDMLIRFLTSYAGTVIGRYGDVVATFRSVYPTLFAHPWLIERLEVYEGLWNLVQLHHWRPGDRWMSDPAEPLRQLLKGEFAARVNAFLDD